MNDDLLSTKVREQEISSDLESLGDLIQELSVSGTER